MVARDAALAGYEDARVHFQHLSCVESVEALALAKEAGVRVSAEVTPHHLTLTDDVVRTLDSRFKMNPPLRSETRPPRAGRGAAERRDRLRRDRPRPARAAREGGSVRAGADGDDRAGDRVRRHCTPSSSCPASSSSSIVIERMTAGGALYGLPTPRIATGEPANVCLVDLDAKFEVGAEGYVSRSAELLLPRTHAPRPGAAHASRPGRSRSGRRLLTEARSAR